MKDQKKQAKGNSTEETDCLQPIIAFVVRLVMGGKIILNNGTKCWKEMRTPV